MDRATSEGVQKRFKGKSRVQRPWEIKEEKRAKKREGFAWRRAKEIKWSHGAM